MFVSRVWMLSLRTQIKAKIFILILFELTRKISHKLIYICCVYNTAKRKFATDVESLETIMMS